MKRAGHTEASVDLALLAGLNPAAVICEIVDDDGSMARLPRLREFAEKENLKIVSIADLIRYIVKICRDDPCHDGLVISLFASENISFRYGCVAAV